MQNKSFIVYHIGHPGYKDIRSGYFLPDKKNEIIKSLKNLGKSDSYIKEYLKSINCFPGKINYKMVEKLKNNNFELYQNIDNLEVYYIDLFDRKNKINIEYIKIESTPQQIAYDKRYFEKEKKKAGADKSPEKFKKFFDEYRKNRSKYLEQFYNIKEKFSVDELYQSLNSNLKDLKNMKKYFDLNANKGLKNQYASYIPHLQIKIKQPLKIYNHKKLKDLK